MTTDELTLYTNHRCPWAQRAHIALAELGIPYKEVLVDLDKPRTPDYLLVNPRGLVPALNWNGEVLIESGVVAQFLVDQYPSHLVPTSSEKGGALRRARIALFVDAFFKIWPPLYKLTTATKEEAPGLVDTLVQGLEGGVEPLLADAAPFFGGSSQLTFAEVLTGSFVIRFVTLASADIYPVTGVLETVAVKAPRFTQWAEKVVAHKSVNGKFEAEDVVAAARRQREKALGPAGK